jgi:hypothetical protein
MRTLKDTTIKDHLRVWLGWSTFGRTLFREMSSRSINTTMRDFVAWMKILVTLMFYKCTVKSHVLQVYVQTFAYGVGFDKEQIYGYVASTSTFGLYIFSCVITFSFAMHCNITFVTTYVKEGRTFMNRVMREHRMFYGTMLWCPKHCTISLDDDKVFLLYVPIC